MQDIVDGGCGPDGNAIAQLVKHQEQLSRVRDDAQEVAPPEDVKARLRNRASVFERQIYEQDSKVDENLHLSQEAIEDDPAAKRMFDDFLRATQDHSFLHEYATSHAPAAAGDLAVDHFAGPNFHGLLAQFPYVFTEKNPFVAINTPFEDALKLYQEGELRAAILAFEAEVQRHPQSSEAWRWLGTAHAENDEDKLAIASLLRAVDADPENLGALLDLGVSFTNELAQSHALRYLKMWIEKHPQYGVIAEKVRFNEGDFTWMGFHNMHLKVTRMMLMKELSTISHRSSEMFHMAEEMNRADPDVYTVLGVLYNLSRDWDRAEDCFKRALDLDANNYSLWNKLGATQANGTKNNGSSEAVYAYRHALELKPNYVRAWVNMGISYANQNKHQTAAKYYIKALRQNETAEHIWSYLRIACTSLGREELIALIDARDTKILSMFG